MLSFFDACRFLENFRVVKRTVMLKFVVYSFRVFSCFFNLRAQFRSREFTHIYMQFCILNGTTAKEYFSFECFMTAID